MLRPIALSVLVVGLALAPLAHTAEEPARALLASGAVAHSTSGAAEVASACAPAVKARVVDGTRGIVSLSWDPCPDVAGYRVLRASAGAAEPAGGRSIVEVRHSSHVDTGLTPGALYVYSVVPSGSDLPAALQGVAVTIE